MRPISFCVHTYNEADALRRLVESSVPLADLFDEWVVVDHRSSDKTGQVVEELRALLADHQVTLKASHECRDFSKTYTFADLRTQAIKACRNPLVVLHDADFLLGPGFRALLIRAKRDILDSPTGFYAISYAVPVVWDRLALDAAGTVTDHGRVWVHNRRPRIFLRDAVHYEQTKDRGRWERLVVRGARRRKLELSGKTTPIRDAVLSVNVKPAERIALRDTMTMFMQDAMQGKTQGTWLENYQRGSVRQQPAYEYRDLELRGWKVNIGALELCA